MADLSINLGRIFGIRLEMHWTFLLLLLFAALYGPVLFLLIVVLFALVVAHELAHSITAMRSGFRVKKVILLPLGGASIIDLDEVPKEDAFRIALAGPLMSIFLALIFGIFAIYAPSGVIQQSLQWLFLVNLLLGGFNLLPAFPLDGGRVLESYLERKRDKLSATKLAVKISEITLVIFIIASLIIFSGSLYSDTAYFFLTLLFDLLIAVFIYQGARAELNSAYINKYAAGLSVSAAASKNFTEISPNALMRDAYKILINDGTHILLFQKNGKTFLVEKAPYDPLSKKAAEALDRKVSDFSIQVPTVAYNAPLSKAIEKMRYDDSAIVAARRGKRITGVLLAQHVESIIALHMPHAMKEEKAAGA